MAKAVIFDQYSPDYQGVIGEGSGVRLVVSPRGAVYALQEPDGSAWRDFRLHNTGAGLRAYCDAVMIDPPEWLSAVVAGLPDAPRDCPQVPVPTGGVASRL